MKLAFDAEKNTFAAKLIVNQKLPEKFLFLLVLSLLKMKMYFDFHTKTVQELESQQLFKSCILVLIKMLVLCSIMYLI